MADLAVDVLSRVARAVSITAPASWPDATREEHVELRDDYLPIVADEILDRVDLPSPIGKQTTVTGDGSASYDLPSDFRRLARDQMAIYETTRLRRAGMPITTDGAWTHVVQIGGAGSYRYFRIAGYPGAYTIEFEDALSTGASVTVSYVQNNFMIDGSTEKRAVTAATDALYLPRRVVEAGMIARYRERLGMDWQTHAIKYEAELSRLENDSRNRRVISFGGHRSFKPMRVPVPDYIPQS